MPYSSFSCRNNSIIGCQCFSRPYCPICFARRRCRSVERTSVGWIGNWRRLVGATVVVVFVDAHRRLPVVVLGPGQPAAAAALLFQSGQNRMYLSCTATPPYRRGKTAVAGWFGHVVVVVVGALVEDAVTRRRPILLVPRPLVLQLLRQPLAIIIVGRQWSFPFARARKRTNDFDRVDEKPDAAQNNRIVANASSHV
jgi:hypothetical protein